MTDTRLRGRRGVGGRVPSAEVGREVGRVVDRLEAVLAGPTVLLQAVPAGAGEMILMSAAEAEVLGRAAAECLRLRRAAARRRSGSSREC